MKVDEYDIQLYNPQLRGKKFEVPPTKRKIFGKVERTLEVGGITSIVGLRRVGKTILVKQLLNSLIDRGREVFYFSFDEERYAVQDGLDSVIRTALEIMDSPIVALDEISRIRGWSGIVKKYHDAAGIRFLISGSSSLEITKGKESLAGRLHDIYLPPLQYMEFVSFLRGRDPEEGPVMDLLNPERTFARLKDRRCLEQFISRGGFPELVGAGDDDFARKYIISSTVEKIIFEDLPKAFDIKDENALFRIWELVSANPSMLFVPSNLEHVIGLSRETISRYLFYLERAYLVNSVFREGSVTSKMRKGRKVYPPTACIAYQIGRDDTSMGAVAETAVLDKLLNGFGMKVRFHSGKGRSEVDFIADGIPIEVKYQATITPSDHHNLVGYMRKRGVSRGVMVTRSNSGRVETRYGTVVMIPLELFLQLEKMTSA